MRHLLIKGGSEDAAVACRHACLRGRNFLRRARSGVHKLARQQFHDQQYEVGLLRGRYRSRWYPARRHCPAVNVRFGPKHLQARNRSMQQAPHSGSASNQLEQQPITIATKSVTSCHHAISLRNHKKCVNLMPKVLPINAVRICGKSASALPACQVKKPTHVSATTSTHPSFAARRTRKSSFMRAIASSPGSAKRR